MKQRSVIDDKAFDPNIGTAKHWPKIIGTPEFGVPLYAVDIPNAKLFRPRLFTRSQLGAEPTENALFHLLPRIPCNPILTNAPLAITASLTRVSPSRIDSVFLTRTVGLFFFFFLPLFLSFLVRIIN